MGTKKPKSTAFAGKGGHFNRKSLQSEENLALERVLAILPVAYCVQPNLGMISSGVGPGAPGKETIAMDIPS